MAYSFGLVPDRGAHLRSNNRADACLNTYRTSRDEGVMERKILWIETDFNSEHSAFYSARVLENLTCRRSMSDATGRWHLCKFGGVSNFEGAHLRLVDLVHTQ